MHVMDAFSPHFASNAGDKLASFSIATPKTQSSPLVFASPHSGRRYPAELMGDIIATRHQLRRIEDAYVDELFANTPENLGAPLLHALIGRACIDLNRASNELDPAMFAKPLRGRILSRSARVHAGLGCIPRIAYGGAPIYDRKLSLDELSDRFDVIYHPYHSALDTLVKTTRQAFGVCFLVDCHSMPSDADVTRPLDDIVLGDRFGGSCTSQFTSIVEQALSARGYKVSRNTPYAGGHVTMTHGRPERGRHAIQIEINRRLYLDENAVEPTQDMQRLKQDLEDAFLEVSDWTKSYAEDLQNSSRRKKAAPMKTRPSK